jgi:type II secretory pathway pseudopilin PulG
MRQRGSIYVGVMTALAIVGVMLMEMGKTWSVIQRREREEQLLFVGDQIRRGLANYASSGPVAGTYPKSMEVLIQDPRRSTVVRHLRRLYADPLSGKFDWGIVPGLGGTIMGVYSQAGGTPMRQANFPKQYVFFAGKSSYREWVFSSMEQAGGEAPVDILPPKPGVLYQGTYEKE